MRSLSHPFDLLLYLSSTSRALGSLSFNEKSSEIALVAVGMKRSNLLCLSSFCTSLALLSVVSLSYPQQSQGLLLLGNGKFNGPSPFPSSPTEWLAQIFEDDRPHYKKKDTKKKDNDDKDDLAPPRKSSTTLQGTIRGWRHVRAVLLVQVIRIVLFFHQEGLVLRRLPNRVLMEIVQQAVQEEARPRLLRMVATELDRRRQGM